MPTQVPTFSPSALPGNWTILTEFTSITFTAAITADEAITCGVSQCLRFDKVRAKQLTSEFFPWNTTHVVAAGGNQVVIAGETETAGNSNAIVVFMDLNSNPKLQGGKISFDNTITAINVDVESKQLSIVSSKLGWPIVVALNQTTQTVLWEKTYPISAAFNAIASIVFNGLATTYIASNVVEKKVYVLKLDPIGLVLLSKWLLLRDLPDFQFENTNCVLIENTYGTSILGGSITQISTNDSKAIITYEGWGVSYVFLGGKNNRINALVMMNTILYALGDASGFGLYPAVSDLMLIKMDVNTEDVSSAIRISSNDGEPIRSYSISAQKMNRLEIVFTVGGRIAVVSLDANTLIPVKISSSLSIDPNFLTDLQFTLTTVLARVLSFAAQSSAVWSKNNTQDIANYTHTSLLYTQPSLTPTPMPSQVPIIIPSTKPTQKPSPAPSTSLSPTELALSEEPTAEPTMEPTSEDLSSENPSSFPSSKPSGSSTGRTAPPSFSPTLFSTPTGVFKTSPPSQKTTAAPTVTASQGSTVVITVQLSQQITPVAENSTSDDPSSSTLDPSQATTLAPVSPRAEKVLATTSISFLSVLVFCLGIPFVYFLIKQIKQGCSLPEQDKTENNETNTLRTPRRNQVQPVEKTPFNADTIPEKSPVNVAEQDAIEDDLNSFQVSSDSSDNDSYIDRMVDRFAQSSCDEDDTDSEQQWDSVNNLWGNLSNSENNARHSYRFG